MLPVIGFLIVLGCVLGGFTLAGGPVLVLLVWSEYLVIGGMALGTLVAATPPSVLRATVAKAFGVLRSTPFTRQLYLDALLLLYELFQIARRDGLVAIETHIEDPAQSIVFQRYPRVTARPEAVAFLTDSLRVVLVGNVPAYDLDTLMDSEIEAYAESDARVVHAIAKLADALPGMGIVAAVLGIIVTMQSVGGPIEEVGAHVASALVGTFLGILLSYGFAGPLATAIEMRDEDAIRFLQCLKAGVGAFAKGFPPIVAVEFARRAIPEAQRPTFLAMETACRDTAKRDKAA